MAYEYDEKSMRIGLAVTAPLFCGGLALHWYRYTTQVHGFNWPDLLLTSFFPVMIFIFLASLSSLKYQVARSGIIVTFYTLFGLKRKSVKIPMQSIAKIYLSRHSRGRMSLLIFDWNSEAIFSYGRLNNNVWEFFKDSFRSLQIPFEEEENPHNGNRELKFRRKN